MEEVDVGPCRSSSFPRWYFDAHKGMCIPFNYGGCRGNRDNFERREDCVNTCEILGRGKSLYSGESSIHLESNYFCLTHLKELCKHVLNDMPCRNTCIIFPPHLDPSSYICRIALHTATDSLRSLSQRSQL